MKKLIFVFTFLSISVSGQDLNFDIQSLKLDDYLNLEKKIDGIKTDNDSNQIQLFGENEVIKFEHKKNDNLNLETTYVFKKNDSSLLFIRYYWKSKFNKSLLNTALIETQESYSEKHNEIKTQISSKFGDGISEEIEETYVGSSKHGKTNKGFNEEIYWKLNDGKQIKMISDISSLYEKGQLSGYPSIFYIRMDVIFPIKNENSTTSQPNKNIEILKKTANDFFKKLKSNDLDNAKQYLSSFIREDEKTELLNSIISENSFKRKTKFVENSASENFFKYINSNLIKLKYKYLDKGNKVVFISFDETGKIYSAYTTSQN